MHGTVMLRVSSATDPGLKRSVNEDRLLADGQRGVFLVADGMGGHAAGDLAAQIALDTIRENLSVAREWTETVARQAIAAANNCIFEEAQRGPNHLGMACVLTLALVEADRLTWGHVGDSRLYLISNGTLRKLTRDHSPVGEREDNGELDEYAAMRHPLRNEVFRDVGSVPRHFDDEHFIETGSARFSAGEAFLLCSDGLSDRLSSAEILQIIEGYREIGTDVAEHLVDAANEQGGDDNVSVIFVAGAEFEPAGARRSPDTRQRHAITRARPRRHGFSLFNARFSWLLIGMLLGALLATAWVKRDDLREQLSKLPVLHGLKRTGK